MCIRDSAEVDFLVGDSTKARDVLKWEPKVSFEQLVKMMVCLLYTSDAADDLLCVDLGGRRISKKKTKNKYEIITARY